MKTHCAACGNDASRGPMTTRQGKTFHVECDRRIRETEAADRKIAANLTAGHPKPYDFPTSGYRTCESCGTRGPLVLNTHRQAVCKDGCTR